MFDERCDSRETFAGLVAPQKLAELAEGQAFIIFTVHDSFVPVLTAVFFSTLAVDVNENSVELPWSCGRGSKAAQRGACHQIRLAQLTDDEIDKFSWKTCRRRSHGDHVY